VTGAGRLDVWPEADILPPTPPPLKRVFAVVVYGLAAYFVLR
jgi:hypothetical protein